MHKRKLGKSGIEVSALGLGCWAIGGTCTRDGKPAGWHGADDRESLRALQRAFDLGIDYLDTANAYGAGHSERLIGEAIAGRRDRVVISTKFGAVIDEGRREIVGQSAEPDYIRAECERSLQRLGTDYIDVYFYHHAQGDDGPAVLEVLEELVAAGKIRSYGWSTDDPARAKLFAKGKRCAAIQQYLNVIGGNRKTLAQCRKYRVASVNRTPLSMGILTGKFRPESVFPADDVRADMRMDQGVGAELLAKLDAVREVLTSDGRSLAQGALAWLWGLSDITIPIPGFKTVAQVEDNAGALDKGPLTRRQVRQVDRLLARFSRR